MQDTTLTQSPDRPYHSFLDATRARFQSVVGPLFEAFSKTGKLEACEGQVAAGLSIHEPIRIRAAGTEYTINGLE